MRCVVRHALLLDVGKFCKAFVDFDTNYLLESHWGQLRNTQAPKAAPKVCNRDVPHIHVGVLNRPAHQPLET